MYTLPLGVHCDPWVQTQPREKSSQSSDDVTTNFASGSLVASSSYPVTTISPSLASSSIAPSQNPSVVSTSNLVSASASSTHIELTSIGSSSNIKVFNFLVTDDGTLVDPSVSIPNACPILEPVALEALATESGSPVCSDALASSPRTLIYVSQGETARLNTNQTPNTDLLMTDLQHCVGVVFKDQKGHTSVTHVDADTSLHFLSTERLYMQGSFTIDIYQNPASKGDLATHYIYPYIKSILGNISNSKGTSEVMYTLTGNLLVREHDTVSLTVNQLKLLREVKQKGQGSVSRNHPLRNCFIDEGNKALQIRMAERFGPIKKFVCVANLH